MEVPIDWFENDELFRELLETGHAFAVKVAEALLSEGLAVTVTPMEWRETIEDRHEFADECDLVVGRSRQQVVDVKSRKLRFSGPADFPYRTAFVDTVSGWNAKTRKPIAIVLVSQRIPGGMAVIPRSTEPQWTQEIKYDRTREIEDRYYMIEKSLLRPIGDLVAYLRANTD
jgi:hypothetical protein